MALNGNKLMNNSNDGGRSGFQEGKAFNKKRILSQRQQTVWFDTFCVQVTFEIKIQTAVQIFF